MLDMRPIGVFDSGFGGISVLAEAARLLPDEDFIFLGDNLHAPYGDRTPEAVLALTRNAVERLIRLDCKAIVLACNTATSAAAATLRHDYSLPIIGMEPALKPAALLPGEGSVLVMATAMTLRLPKFQTLMAQYGKHAVPVPCPGLVELIEAGETSGSRIQARINELLAVHLRMPVKAVVLGCTHYVFLRPTLAACLPQGTLLVDGNAGTARRLRDQLQTHGLRKNSAGENMPGGRITYLSTAAGDDTPQRMRAWFALAMKQGDTGCNSTVGTVQWQG